MKVGLLGPKEIVKRTHGIIKENFPDADLVDYIYESYLEVPEIVEKNQQYVDAFFFPGKTPYKFTEAKVKRETIWEFMPRQGSTLLRALLEASHRKKVDITRISFDTYTEDMLLRAYEEIGIEAKKLNIYIAEQRLEQIEYYEYLMKFHKHNYQYNGVECCITGITEIYEGLRQLAIPCIRTTATANITLLTYNKIELKYLAQTYRNSQIVVIAVRVDLPNSYSIDRGDEYLYLVNKNKVLEKVYLFADNIEAAVVENTDREFLLFTTKKILESETDNLNDIYLLDLLRETVAKNVSIGIGYGETAREAKYNAYEGIGKSIKNGGNVAFAVYEYNQIRGPFRFYKKEETNVIDKELLDISRETGVSNNTLFKIYKVVVSSGEKEYTSKELALICDMSKRNMDRIIQKLEAAGVCKVVGERIMSDTGRPTRIIRFMGF